MRERRIESVVAGRIVRVSCRESRRWALRINFSGRASLALPYRPSNRARVCARAQRLTRMRAKFRRTTRDERAKKLKDRALLPGPFLFGRWRYRRARDLRVSGTLIRLRRLYRDAIPGSIIRLEAGSPTAGYHPREILLSTLANVASVVALFLGTAVGVSAVYFARSRCARRISVRFENKLWIRSISRFGRATTRFRRRRNSIALP